VAAITSRATVVESEKRRSPADSKNYKEVVEPEKRRSNADSKSSKDQTIPPIQNP